MCNCRFIIAPWISSPWQLGLATSCSAESVATGSLESAATFTLPSANNNNNNKESCIQVAIKWVQIWKTQSTLTKNTKLNTWHWLKPKSKEGNMGKRMMYVYKVIGNGELHITWWTTKCWIPMVLIWIHSPETKPKSRNPSFLKTRKYQEAWMPQMSHEKRKRWSSLIYGLYWALMEHTSVGAVLTFWWEPSVPVLRTHFQQQISNCSELWKDKNPTGFQLSRSISFWTGGFQRRFSQPSYQKQIY